MILPQSAFLTVQQQQNAKLLNLRQIKIATLVTKYIRLSLQLQEILAFTRNSLYYIGKLNKYIYIS